jgi:ABC-type transport system involved in multi-copper enzyme maturation permease subunit
MTMTSLTARPGEPASARRTRAVPPAARRPGFAGTLRSEFTKIRSVRSTYFTLIAFFVAGVAFSIAATAGNAANWSHTDIAAFDATATSLNGTIYLGELIIVVIGAMVITSEYGTRMMATSLTAMPRRGVLYGAKAAVLTAVTAVIALITSFASFFTGQAILGPGHEGASITSPGALRAVLLSTVFVTCCALLAFGLGAAIRHTAGAITTLFGAVFLIPALAHALPNSWFFEIARWLPGGDALAPITATKPLPGPNYLYGPYGQVAVFAGYAVIAMAVGALLFRRRDA